MTLEQFVRDRVEEEVLLARLALAVPAPVAVVPTGGVRQRERRVIDAVDRWELLALADTAEHDSRPDLAHRLRLRLADDYSSHSDFDPSWAVATRSTTSQES